MALGRIKTEHSGAKHAKGAWMTKKDAKRTSNKLRRNNDKLAKKEGD